LANACGNSTGNFEIGIERDLDPVAGHRRPICADAPKAPFTRESVASRLVLGIVCGHGQMTTVPSVPSITTRSAAAACSSRPGTAEHRRQAEGARDDRGVAVGAAELGGEARDVLRSHQCGVGRGQLIGENYGTLPQAPNKWRRVS